MKLMTSSRLSGRIPALLISALLTACSTNYVVDAEFPTPLVEPIPASVDLSLSEEFSNYIFVEDTKGRKEISVDIGQAQVELFQTMTASMFSGSSNPDMKLQITPSIEDFQYAVPRETRAEIYEIWLKYRVLVTTSDGETLADWLITGYGKTPTAFLKSAQEAIDMATGIALRDIGGQLSIGFRRQPDIQAWLTRTNAEQS